MGPCLFCDIAAGKIPCDQVHSDEKFLAFRDIDPQFNGRNIHHSENGLFGANIFVVFHIDGGKGAIELRLDFGVGQRLGLNF